MILDSLLNFACTIPAFTIEVFNLAWALGAILVSLFNFAWAIFNITMGVMLLALSVTFTFFGFVLFITLELVQVSMYVSGGSSPGFVQALKEELPGATMDLFGTCLEIGTATCKLGLGMLSESMPTASAGETLVQGGGLSVTVKPGFHAEDTEESSSEDSRLVMMAVHFAVATAVKFVVHMNAREVELIADIINRCARRAADRLIREVPACLWYEVVFIVIHVVAWFLVHVTRDIYAHWRLQRAVNNARRRGVTTIARPI